MNKQQKQVLQHQLQNEKNVLHNLKVKYKNALDDINGNIAKLKARTDTENMQSIIYRVQYQEALKQQVSGILDALNGQQFTTISDYLQKSYEDGFVGVLYDLHGQGIPFIFPIDQKQVVKAVQLDTKLSKPLYNTLGENITNLKYRISDSISRGIASNAGYSDMAKQVTRYMVGDYSGMKGGALGKAMQIARTESHRITNEATHDAQTKAKENGADIVKQWDATIDRRTRPDHAHLDGQIREIDEEFEVNGHRALYPGAFGVASEDINCRCAVLQRAKWALDEEELQILKDRAEYFGLDKTEDFENFKKNYLSANLEKPRKNDIISMRLNSRADPMADYYGSGYKSNPKEIELFKKEIADCGVELIIPDAEKLGYEPGFVRGQPGRIIIYKNASYSAWCHEMQHLRDDKADGWGGFRVLADPDEHYRREVRAYNAEISIAKKLGNNEVVKQLLTNLEEERRRIYNEI